jgi:tRNA(Ile)-lysidine synthase
MGLLHAMHDWSTLAGRTLRVATVDHGLRSESRTEAKFVARVCRDLDITQDILTWNATPEGNLQAAARTARYDLLTVWAKTNDVACVLLGHTEDDRAETFMMRLARGSGVDGLAGMGGHRRWNGVLWGRPLLDTSRAVIRKSLTLRAAPWIDDPSNDDDRFDRVKARAALAALAPLGLTKERLNETAFRMSVARDALEAKAVEAAKTCVELQSGDVVINLQTLNRFVPLDLQWRIVSAGLCFVSSNRYRPRLKRVSDLIMLQHLAKARTLHGAHVSGDRDEMRITREANAVKNEVRSGGETWDARWQIDGPLTPDLTICALGDHIKDVPDWRDSVLPRASLMASPAVFDGDTLIAAPIAGYKNGFSARIVADFESFLVSR